MHGNLETARKVANSIAPTSNSHSSFVEPLVSDSVTSPDNLSQKTGSLVALESIRNRLSSFHGQLDLEMSTIETRLEIDEKGNAKLLDKNGKDWSKSYADRFTEKLREHGIEGVTYNANSPFVGRNEKEREIVQKIARELST